MPNNLAFARRHRVRTLIAAFAAVMLLGGTAACSSSSDSKSGGKSGSDSNQMLPDGFPDDVPMPEFEKINTVKSGTGATPGIWSVFVTIDPSMRKSSADLMAAYRGQLEDAGFEVGKEASGIVMAENDKWSINFRSSMDGTLTIGTAPK